MWLVYQSYLKYGDAMEKEMEIHFGSKLDEGVQFILFSEVHRDEERGLHLYVCILVSLTRANPFLYQTECSSTTLS